MVRSAIHIVMGGHWALVAEPKHDHADIDAGLQEMHGRGVTAQCNVVWFMMVS